MFFLEKRQIINEKVAGDGPFFIKKRSDDKARSKKMIKNLRYFITQIRPSFLKKYIN